MKKKRMSKKVLILPTKSLAKKEGLYVTYVKSSENRFRCYLRKE